MGIKAALHRDRSMKSFLYCRPKPWYCDGCKKYHGANVDRVITTDKQTMCFRQFYKYLDRKGE